jgi:hypothetical protein
MVAPTLARRGRGPRLGIALSTGAVCAAITRPGASRVEMWRATLAPLNGDGGWPSLTDALRTLATDTGIADGRLTVALMPPLAEARNIDLPPLNNTEMQQLLARSAAKYFVGARGPQVVGAVTVPGHAEGNLRATVAVAAGARLVNAIHDAASAAGWTVETVVPAEAAWGAAAAQWASHGHGGAQLLVAHADRTDLLTVSGAALVGIRRFRAGAEDAALIADAYAAGAGRVSIAGAADARRELTRQLAARGVAVETPPGANADITEHPDLLAAAFATPDVTPALVTETMRVARAAFMKRVTVRLAAAAALLLVGSLVIEWQGMRRELNAIKAQRTALGPQIATTLVGKTTVEKALGQLTVLAAEERRAPHWSSTIAALSERLPSDVFLTGFRGRGDSISVDGLAVHAARVFDAIEKVPGLVEVRSAGPVRIEKPTEGPPMERFAIAALLAHAGGSKSSAARPLGPKPLPAPVPKQGGAAK